MIESWVELKNKFVIIQTKRFVSVSFGWPIFQIARTMNGEKGISGTVAIETKRFPRALEEKSMVVTARAARTFRARSNVTWPRVVKVAETWKTGQ